MNRFDIEDLKRKPEITERDYDPEKMAEKSAYLAEIDGKRQLYIPSFAVYHMIIATAKKHPHGKGSLSHVELAKTIRIEPEKIPLGHCDYEVDVRPIVLRIGEKTYTIRKARARVPEWMASFNIIYMSEIILDPYILRGILEDAGCYVGLLDYRPQHMGTYGTFVVKQFYVEGEAGIMEPQSISIQG